MRREYKMTHLPLRYALCAAVVAAVLATVIPTDVEACDYLGDWEFAAAVPDDGAEVPADVQFSVWRTGPVRSEPQFELTAEDGEAVSISTTINAVGEDSIETVEQTVIAPDEPLEVGSTYTLEATVEEESVDQTGQVTDVNTRRSSLSVDVVETDADSPSSVDDIEWTSTDARGTSCHPDREQWHEVDIEANGVPDDAWFEIRYLADDRTIATIGQPTAEPARHTLGAEADCIAVDVVGADGSRSEKSKSCEPDTCKLDEGFDDTRQIRCDHERPTRLSPEP